MSIVPFPRSPLRAIKVRPFADDQDMWIGRFIGDHGLRGFRTEVGPLHIVLAALKNSNHRSGLPIIIERPGSPTSETSE
jgi:hypothetical protein